jgi:pyruvate dehydrogenase E1 component alpha subunit
MSLHTTADDPTVYRDESLVEPWKARCPIRRIERVLLDRGALEASDPERIRTECEQEVLEARQVFRDTATAKPREIFDHLYGDMPGELEEQRMAYLRRLDRKGVE